MRKFLIIVLLCQCFFYHLCAVHGSGLVVLIDQESLPVHPQVLKDAISFIDKKELRDQAFLEVLSMAPLYKGRDIDENKFAVAFDNVRLEWIKQTAKKYDTIYAITGGQTRDRKQVQELLEKALTNHPSVDLLVMGKLNYNFLMIDLSSFPGKLRLVAMETKRRLNLSDAQIVVRYNNSALSSPFIFAFLKSWFGGHNFKSSVVISEREGQIFFNNNAGFKFARLFHSFKKPENAINASKLFFEKSNEMSEVSIHCHSVKQVIQEPSTWKCAFCTFHNEMSDNCCALCDAKR